VIRSVLFLFLAALVAAVLLSLAGESGRASILWLGWRADMTATALLVLVLLVSLLAFAAWRLVLWVVPPGRQGRRPLRRGAGPRPAPHRPRRGGR